MDYCDAAESCAGLPEVVDCVSCGGPVEQPRAYLGFLRCSACAYLFAMQGLPDATEHD